MKTQIPYSGWIIQVSACFLVLVLVSGCVGTFGHYKRDSEVFEAFNNDQVPLDYRYYYYHSGSEPNTAKFKNLIDWIWEDYGYTR